MALDELFGRREEEGMGWEEDLAPLSPEGMGREGSKA
jgi:hypothetical protein